MHVAVIVNLSNPVENLSLKELAKHRPDPANAVARRPENHRGACMSRATRSARRFFDVVYGMNEAGFTRYFLHATFTGRIPNGPRQLETSEGLRRFVVNVPGAVGFVRLADVDASVKTVRVDGACRCARLFPDSSTRPPALTGAMTRRARSATVGGADLRKDRLSTALLAVGLGVVCSWAP